MRIRRLAAAIVCAALIAQPALAQRWWEEAAASQPLDEVALDGDGARRINWSDGYLEVVAEGTCDPAMSQSQAHCRTIALKTARALGYGTVYLTGSIPPAALRKAANVPDHFDITCVIPVGVPEEWPKTPPKKELNELIVHESF